MNKQQVIFEHELNKYKLVLSVYDTFNDYQQNVL